jgi:hypothetical protein
MAYVDPQSLDANDTVLVYIAGKTSEAKAVESLLTQNAFSYTIKPTPFLRSSIFGGMIQLPGVGFYVLTEQAADCRTLLQDNKFKVGLVQEGEE